MDSVSNWCKFYRAEVGINRGESPKDLLEFVLVILSQNICVGRGSWTSKSQNNTEAIHTHLSLDDSDIQEPVSALRRLVHGTTLHLSSLNNDPKTLPPTNRC